MADLQQKFLKMLTGPCRVNAKSGMVVAVSGGPDSMALLHLLAGVREQLDLALTIVWLDHGLRPRETPLEHQIVAGAAETLEIPFVAIQVDAADAAARHNLSIEHAARNLRYRALRSIARERQAELIGVAHTADDQVEEILLRLLRGSGRKGLSGMNMRSNDLVRPLLCTNKSELIDWLEEREIEYCLDSSNEELKYLRNRVRLKLLPFLEKEFDVSIRKSLRKTADSLAEDEQLLAELTAAAIAKVTRKGEGAPATETSMQIMRQPFCRLHAALQRRVVEQLLWQMGSRAGYDHILLIVEAAAHGRNNSELHLSQGLRLGVYRDYLELSYPAGRIPWRGRLLSCDQ